MDTFLLVSPNCGDLAAPNFEVKQFPDKENYIHIPSPENLKGKNVTILHRCYPDQDAGLIQLLQVITVVKQYASKVSAIVPYLPYSRQDHAVRSGEAETAKIVCSLLAKAGLDLLITFDCHFIKEGAGQHEYAGLKIDNRTLGPVLLEYVKPKVTDPVYISPDVGASYMVEEAGGVAMEKQRGDYAAGPTAFRQITKQKLDISVTGKDVVVLDDMIEGGDTMVNAVSTCKRGGAKRIIAAAVHGLMVHNAFDRIRAAGAREVIVSDSVPGPAAVVSITSGLKDYLK
ncbi:Ribose-phosphate pyrophosphokinase [Candidatus Gugararchaeum adminiculabundum]|nr:Ribose-phosphate pyrophosphokinase [Candidatus Gugararchaeum adminiculabundum]